MVREISIQFEVERDNFDGKPFAYDRHDLPCHTIPRIYYHAKVSEVAGKFQDVLLIIAEDIALDNLAELSLREAGDIVSLVLQCGLFPFQNSVGWLALCKF